MTPRKIDFAKRVELLQRCLDEADATLTVLAEERKHFALAAVEADPKALKQIGQLDADAAKLHREKETLLDAIEQLKQQQRDSEAEAAKLERQRREAAARQLADAVLKVSGEIDDALNTLHSMFEQRSRLLHELADTKIVEAGYLQRLHRRFIATSAARAAQLQQFIEIEHVAPGQVRSLADAAAGLRGPLTASVGEAA